MRDEKNVIDAPLCHIQSFKLGLLGRCEVGIEFQGPGSDTEQKHLDMERRFLSYGSFCCLTFFNVQSAENASLGSSPSISGIDSCIVLAVHTGLVKPSQLRAGLLFSALLPFTCCSCLMFRLTYGCQHNCELLVT